MNLFTLFKQPPCTIDTGLKAVDLLAPIPAGGNVLLTGEPHAGVRLLGTEIAFRLATSVNRHRVAIFVDSALPEIEAIAAELQELHQAIKTVYVTSAITTQDIQHWRRTASKLAQDAVFAISFNERFLYEFQLAVMAERNSASSSVMLTSFSVTEVNVPSGFDATLFSSRTIAKEGIYPAFDPRVSNSNATSNAKFSRRRKQIADAARTAICDVVECLVPGALGDPDWIGNRDISKHTGVQLLRFLSQPYFIGEAYTGQKAAFVPIKVIKSNFEAILSGRFANASNATLTYQNQL